MKRMDKMSDLPKDIRLEVRARNNLILTKMEERGIHNIAELCRQMGAPSSYGSVVELVSMKKTARRRDDDWRSIVYRLSEFFGCMPEDLFSDHQQYSALEDNRVIAELSFAEVQQLTSRRLDPITPELAVQTTELRDVLSRALATLTPREERILRLRFGIGIGEEMTLGEVGEQFGISVNRVREIEAKALRRLRHPSRGVLIKTAGGKPVGTIGTGIGAREIYNLDEDILDAL